MKKLLYKNMDTSQELEIWEIIDPTLRIDALGKLNYH